jgi:signal transduction histidine kinase/DNA-binding response OmpR family regulator
MSMMGDSDKTSILIVDDMPEKLLVYQAVLEELDQDLVAVHSGAEALKQVLRQDFAVILLDVNMPGMDGLETAGYIRQRKRSAHTPIIFLTAFNDELRTAEGYAHGAVDYILTPVVPEILRAKVRVFVELFLMRRQVAQQAEEQAKRAAAEEMARRSAFLAEASRTFTASLDFDTTVRGLLRLVVPSLARLAVFSHAGGPGQPWHGEMAWALPEGGLHYHSLNNPDTPGGALRACHDRVLATGQGEVLLGVAIPALGSAAGEPGYPGECIRSASVFPLVARGRTLGVLTLAQTEPEAGFSAADLSLAEDLANRAAMSLDNARLYRDIQENDQRKNEFLAMLAHELRNPLAPVRNAVELLRMRGPGELEWARDVIDRQITHLTRLVDDLLDVSRITGGKIKLELQRIDAREVVSAALETSRPFIEEHGHVLHLSQPEHELPLRGDPARLTQVLTNLLHNAAKYTPDRGQIWLTVEQSEGDVVFRVRDSGAGIPGEMLAQVFELFTQVDRSLDRSQGGLGVGLTLVQRLVEMHDGSVRAFSEGQGRGSEFVVQLPLAPVAADSPAQSNGAVPSEPGAPVRFRVLIVDDNVDAADSLAMLLGLLGHEVDLAYDGPSALEAAGRFQPQVVLLDIGLPILDGYEVARRLRTASPELLLIAVSGYGQESDRERSRQAGFDQHLIKPVDFDVLQGLLASSGRPGSRGRGPLASVDGCQ